MSQLNGEFECHGVHVLVEEDAAKVTISCYSGNGGEEIEVPGSFFVDVASRLRRLLIGMEREDPERFARFNKNICPSKEGVEKR